MKKCTSCGIEKDKSGFTGEKHWCKECCYAYGKRYRELNADKIRESKRLYSHTEKSKEYKKKWNKENVERTRARYLRYKESHLEEVKARSTLYNLIAHGKNDIRKPCEVCGEIKVEAHHDDYSKPLEVKWLCIKHHKELHRNRRN